MWPVFFMYIIFNIEPLESQHHQIHITGRLGAGASISPLLVCFLVVIGASQGNISCCVVHILTGWHHENSGASHGVSFHVTVRAGDELGIMDNGGGGAS